jgi:hypothetical protein
VDQSQQTSVADDFRRSINLACVLATAHAHCVYPFVRIGYGLQVPGFQGLHAVLLMIVAFIAAEDIAILQFLAAWIVATLVQRGIAFHRHFQGHREHSRYEGFPWLGNLFALGRGGVAAKLFELCVVIVLGCLLSNWSEPLAILVTSASFSLLFVLIVSESAKWRRVTAMVDMELEQRALAERVRQYRNGH